MIKIPRPEKDRKIKDNIIKDTRNLFRLKKEIDGAVIKNIKNLFRLKKENEANKEILGTFLSMKKIVTKQ